MYIVLSKKFGLLDDDEKNMYNKYFSSAIQFYYLRIKSVEIMREDTLEKTYFYLLPYCQRLTVSMKTEFLEDVDVTNSKSKVANLLESSKSLLIRLQY